MRATRFKTVTKASKEISINVPTHSTMSSHFTVLENKLTVDSL